MLCTFPLSRYSFLLPQQNLFNGIEIEPCAIFAHNKFATAALIESKGYELIMSWQK